MNSGSFDPFKQRQQGMEDAFFKDRDRQLMEKLRSQLSAMEEKKKLAHVTGIVEEHVLTNLVEAGVNAETFAAVSLIPLVELAWCDGNVAAEEREAVLNAAAGQGIRSDSASYDLLNNWLTERPDAKIIAAWKEYVGELARIMPPESLASLKKTLLDRLNKVASSAGGFLGLSTISKHEQDKIKEIASAWEV